MSDAIDHNALPEDELVAAEYALGVLTGAERAAAERRVQNERSFATMVAAWEERLSPWATEIESVAPPPQTWDRIVASLPPEPAQRDGLWGNLAFWRVFGLASALAACCLAIVIYFGATRQNEPLMAAIEGGGRRSFVATVDVRRGTIAVVPAAFTALR